MGHAHHIYKCDISVCPCVKNAASYCVIRLSFVSLVEILNVIHLVPGKKQKRHLQLFGVNVSSACDKSWIVAHAAVHLSQDLNAGVPRSSEQTRNSSPTKAHD